MVIGSTHNSPTNRRALLEVAVLSRKINLNHPHLCPQAVTVSELVSHYRQRELATHHPWKTHSTKVTYQGYLNKWILPRWKNYTLSAINAGEVELWLWSLVFALGASQLRQNQKPHERCFQPCHSASSQI
jgi:hypothetical protein